MSLFQTWLRESMSIFMSFMFQVKVSISSMIFSPTGRVWLEDSKAWDEASQKKSLTTLFWLEQLDGSKKSNV